MEVTDIKGYDYSQWVWIKNKLDSITYNRFSCFFDNHILKNEKLFEQFAPMLEQNFKLVDHNWEIINGKDLSQQAGKWKNGEISQDLGFAEMIDPPFGKDPKSTLAITSGIKNFLKVWGLFSRAINCGSGNCCDCGCGCDIKAIVECC